MLTISSLDEIADFRTELTDVLWDFDAFIEVDEFDAEEFTKLRALSRKHAPRVYDILMRMKLENPVPDFFSASGSRGTSVAGFSDGPALSADHQREDVMPPQEDAIDEVAQLASMMGTQAGPDLGLESSRSDSRQQNMSEPVKVPEPLRLESAASIARSADSVRPEDVPDEPNINPWQLSPKPAVPAEVQNAELGEGLARRGRQQSRDDLLASGRNGWPPHAPEHRPTRHDDLPGIAMPMGPQDDMRRTQTPPLSSTNDSRADSPTAGYWQHRAYAASVTTQSNSSRPPSLPLSMLDGSSDYTPASPQRAPRTVPVMTTLPLRTNHVHSKTNSSSSVPMSLFEASAGDIIVSPTTDPRASLPLDEQSPSSDYFQQVSDSQLVMTAGWSPPPPPRPTIPIIRPPVPFIRPMSIDQPGLEPVQVLVDAGLIVASEAHMVATNQHPLREPDCSINVDSSFYQRKGFCDGAKDIIRGGVGVKKIRKPVCPIIIMAYL
jgi:hypothetical protein